AKRCRSDVLPCEPVPPPLDLPSGRDAQTYLAQQTGLAFARQQPWSNESAARARLELELRLIAERDLAPYLLVCSEICEECRRRGWPVMLRGSGGSSLVCYLLGLTNVDPMASGARVERFLSAGRRDLPDLDLGCGEQNRQALFNWIFKRFKSEHV